MALAQAPAPALTATLSQTALAEHTRQLAAQGYTHDASWRSGVGSGGHQEPGGPRDNDIAFHDHMDNLLARSDEVLYRNVLSDRYKLHALTVREVLKGLNDVDTGGKKFGDIRGADTVVSRSS